MSGFHATVTQQLSELRKHVHAERREFFLLRNWSPVCSLQANRRRRSISMQGLVGRHRCVISVMTRLERAEPCRGRLCSPLVSSERPGQQMCFLKECLRLVGCCRKTVVHLLPSGRVVDCLLCSFSVSLPLLYNQHNCTFAFLSALISKKSSFFPPNIRSIPFLKL